MSPLTIPFLIVATIFAICSVLYVIYEILTTKKPKYVPSPEPILEPVIIPEPIPEPEPVPVFVPVVPEIVEHIDAEEADAMLSDDLAMKGANYESGAGHGKQGIINIGVIDVHFEANDIVTMAALKQKGLIPKNVGRIKILADGILEKPLTIKAESYSLQAIKMIELTGGTVIILRD